MAPQPITETYQVTDEAGRVWAAYRVDFGGDTERQSECRDWAPAGGTLAVSVRIG